MKFLPTLSNSTDLKRAELLFHCSTRAHSAVVMEAEVPIKGLPSLLRMMRLRKRKNKELFHAAVFKFDVNLC